MKEIDVKDISSAVCMAFLKANTVLPSDVVKSVSSALASESDERARQILKLTLENASIAEGSQVPICQDTGLPVVFADIGQDIHIVGGNFEEAINEGARLAYNKGKFRASVVRDPLYDRVNTNTGVPAIIHTKIVPGDRLILTAVPKGFGAENMSRLVMLTPAAEDTDIIDFAVQTAKLAGACPCPPTVLGIGIGGDFEQCALLAKRALTLPVDGHNENEKYAALERRILEAVNATGIGPQGFGGKTSALGARILTAPTHIAGLPVAINISCHVTRHYTAEL